MHRSNVTGLVDRLEARRLVRRKDDPADRRAFNVVITPVGRKLLRQDRTPLLSAQPRRFGASRISPARARDTSWSPELHTISLMNAVDRICRQFMNTALFEQV